jgi:hypothetical protein
MPRRKITEAERADAMRRGHEEGKREYPGRGVSVQVEEWTDEHGHVVYKIMPMAGDA